MRKVLWGLALICVFLPIALVVFWAVSKQWDFPHLFPRELSTRGLSLVLKEGLPLALSSMGLSSLVGIASTAVGLLTARALCLYNFPLKGVIRFLNLLPLMIPPAAFAMGAHVFFLGAGLGDTVFGVFLAHLICSVPYSVNSMTDMQSALGSSLEQQATCLGASGLRAFFETSFWGLMPGFITSFSMAYIVSYSQYFITLILGGGKVKTLSTVMIPYIQSGDRTVSGSFAVLFMGTSLLLLGVARLVTKKIGQNREVSVYGG